MYEFCRKELFLVKTRNCTPSELNFPQQDVPILMYSILLNLYQEVLKFCEKRYSGLMQRKTPLPITEIHPSNAKTQLPFVDLLWFVKKFNLKFAFESGVIREKQVMKSVPLIK